MIFAPENDAAQRALGAAVVQRHFGMLEEEVGLRPAARHVLDRGRESAARRARNADAPRLDACEHASRFGRPQLSSHRIAFGPWRRAIFDGVELRDEGRGFPLPL